MKKTIPLFIGLILINVHNNAQTVIDIDGNMCNTVTIETQLWLKENLKTTHYNNGDSIPLVTNETT